MSATKYTYCPEYDDFFSKSKDILQERLINHLKHREPSIQKALQNTVSEIIERLGYNTFIDECIPTYNTSFINYEEIDKLIHDWTGPIISKQYKEKFHDSSDETEEIDAAKFNKDAINWLDQSSYRVTGKYFFAQHIKAIKSYLNTFCAIIDISQQNRQNLLNYCCIYCVDQLLSIKLKFHRSKQQPLIRNTTLRDSKELHRAFKILYRGLDVAELKKTVKRNNKYNPNKKGNKYRVDSNKFAQNIRIYCSNLLNKERKELAVHIDDDDDNLIPPYFRDIETKNNNNKRNICPPPKPRPPPMPSSSTDSVAPKCHKCCCETPNQYPIRDIPYWYRYPHKRYLIPVPLMNGNPQYQRYYPVSAPFGMNYNAGYHNERGGDYIGSANQFRYNPYHRMVPPDVSIKSETVSDESEMMYCPPIMPSPISVPMMDPISMDDAFDIENVSKGSDTTSPMSLFPNDIDFSF